MVKIKESAPTNATMEANYREKGFGIQTSNKMKKKRRFKEKMKIDKTQLDQISDLGKSVLRLSIAEKPRDTILSNRWRCLWETSISKSILNFDSHTMLRHIHGQLEAVVRRRKFLSVVDQFLELYSGGLNKIETFRVCFDLEKGCARHVDQWVDFAIAAGVRSLHLQLSEGKGRLSNDNLYEFPFQIFFGGKGSCLQHLLLRACVWRPPPGFVVFSSLTSLTLNGVDMVDEDVENFISKLPVLECLRLIHCHNLVTLKLVGQFVQLKYLVVFSMHWCKLREIEIDRVNLETFVYAGPHISIIFGLVPRLAHMHIKPGGANFLLSTLAGIPGYVLGQLESLFLLPCLLGSADLREFTTSIPMLTNLKQLGLTTNAAASKKLVKATVYLDFFPCLQKLRLEVFLIKGDCGQPTEVRRPPIKPHKHLKQVEFTGFRGSWSEMELAVYLLHNAVALETMVIDPRQHGYMVNGEWEAQTCAIGGQPNVWPAGRRERVKELLSKETPTTVQLVLL